MNTLVTFAAGVDVTAAGMVRAESIFDWTQNIATQTQNTMNAVIIAVAVVVAVFIMVRRKFTASSVVMGLLIAGGAIWVVTSGVLWARDRIQETTEASGVVRVVEVEDAALRASAGDLLPDELELR